MSGGTTSISSGRRTCNGSGSGDVLDMLKPNPNWAKLPLFNRKNWSRFGAIVESVAVE
jgi:hypothetical protein